MIAAALAVAVFLNGAILAGMLRDKRVRRVVRGAYTPLVVHNE